MNLKAERKKRRGLNLHILLCILLYKKQSTRDLFIKRETSRGYHGLTNGYGCWSCYKNKGLFGYHPPVGFFLYKSKLFKTLNGFTHGLGP